MHSQRQSSVSRMYVLWPIASRHWTSIVYVPTCPNNTNTRLVFCVNLAKVVSKHVPTASQQYPILPQECSSHSDFVATAPPFISSRVFSHTAFFVFPPRNPTSNRLQEMSPGDASPPFSRQNVSLSLISFPGGVSPPLNRHTPF